MVVAIGEFYQINVKGGLWVRMSCLEPLQTYIAAALAPTSHWFTAQDIEGVSNMTGAYILLLRLDESMNIRIAKQPCGRFAPGWYAYAGSARNKGGIRARLRHHFHSNKKQHWHIDRLTVGAAWIAALPVPGGVECNLLGELLQLPGFGVAMKGFGSSDCRNCESHLVACFNKPAE